MAACFYCNFYLFADYRPPTMLNASQSLNNSRNTIVNVEKDMNSDDVSCRRVQFDK